MRRPMITDSDAGLGFKHAHAADIMAGEHDVRWFEVHPENYMGAGGLPHRMLTDLRERYGLSLHGVGLSIGGEGRLERGSSRAPCRAERAVTRLTSSPSIWLGRATTKPI